MDLTDEALVESFKMTKDLTKFRSVVRRYQNRIFNIAYRVLGNVQEAEEVTQDTFLRVHQNVDKFRAESSFSSWIFAIAYNHCRDALRIKNRHPEHLNTVSFDPQASYNEAELANSQTAPIFQIADTGPGPSYDIDMEDQDKVIQETLLQLPDPQRTVVVLHDIEGMSYQDIADIVGTNVGTVRSRLHYGRQRLKELLDPYFSSKDVPTASR